MIPQSISERHILLALAEIGRTGIPAAARRSKKYCLDQNGIHFPPKYVISLANLFANGKEWPASKFSGGDESNNFLCSRGFRVRVCSCGGTHHQAKTKRNDMGKPERAKSTHSGERCRGCKVTIEKMLNRIFGRCIVGWRPSWGVTPEAYSGTYVEKPLRKILRALESQRGRGNLIKTGRFPLCDYYVPDPGLIIEFDESQHFTQLRKVALQLYPPHATVGYEVGKWLKLCDSVDAHDNSPIYRDEQRAWFDTLRDLIPPLQGMLPTVRLYAGAHQWCSLDVNNISDVERFRSLIGGGTKGRAIELKLEEGAAVARIVLAGQWHGDLAEVHELLTDICHHWPTGNKVKYLITCGGFMELPWPLAPITGGRPRTDALSKLITAARRCCSELLDEDLREKLKKVTRYLTLGVDSAWEPGNLSQLHVELVAIVDLEQDKWYWTGKSYPTMEQAKALLRVSEAETHFVDLHDERVMILGCHDLNMFSRRTQAVTKEWRNILIQNFCNLAQRKAPTRVLHHPHFTDSVNIWKTALSGLLQSLPTVSEFSSSGRWYRTGISGFPEPQRSSLEKVLRATKIGNTIDIIVR